MKKIIITNVLIVLLSLTAMAQDKKVAVMDPAGSIEYAIRDIVREEISSVVINASGYTVLERSLINKVLEENKFQQGGLVDDSQISEIGKRMGANLVFISSLTIMGNGNYYISCKMIDVLTARIEKQKTAQTQQGSNDLIDVVKKMVGEMFGVTVKTSEYPQYEATGANNNNSSHTDLSANLSKYSQGKGITFTCEPFPPFARGDIRGEVKVFFDEDMVWTGGTEGFMLKINDPNPGKHFIRITVEAYQSVKGEEIKIPVLGGAGGTFNINTLQKEYYEFTTNKWNFKVKLK